MRAIVTGGTGLIGRQLCRRLTLPVVLSRDPERARVTLRDVGEITALPWGDDKPFPADALDGVDVVFHLAGEAVAGSRLTTERRRAVK